jgi:methanogenic corrinoid protein MtbC1
MSQVSDNETSLRRAAGAAIEAQRTALAEAVVQREFARRPELLRRYGDEGREKSRRDAEFHLSYLAEAVRVDSGLLFSEYVGWAKILLASRGVGSDVFAAHLATMRDVLASALPETTAALACRMLEDALRELPQLPDTPPEFITPAGRHAQLAGGYLDALLRWDRQLASRLIFDAVERGIPIEDLYLHVFQSSQRAVGRLWQINRVSVAQEHYCSAATQVIMAQLYPRVFSAKRHRGTLIAAAAYGEAHEIGVRMIADVFELRGWNTHYLGANVPPDGVVQAVNEQQADVLAVSATLAYHMGAVERLIAAVRRSAIGAHIKILVGGYAFNIDPRLWGKLGADAYAMDLAEAGRLSEQLAKERSANV